MRTKVRTLLLPLYLVVVACAAGYDSLSPERRAAVANETVTTDARLVTPRTSYSVRTAIPYGPPAQTFDLYKPRGTVAPPAVLYIPGGQGSSSIVQNTAVMYALDSGMAVASLNWRRWSAVGVDTAVSDIKAAMRYLRLNGRALGIDPAAVVVWGSSAGAYMASLNALTCRNGSFGRGGPLECPVATVVYFSDEDLLQRDTDLQAIGCAPRLKPQPGDRYDPIRYVRPGAPIAPMRFEHGTLDCVVSWRQSQRMADSLTAVGLTAPVVIYQGYDHGITRPEWTQPDVGGATIGWLKQQLQAIH